MAFLLTWAPAARFDLREIYAYIAEDNDAAAEKFVESVFEVIDLLVEHPRSGRIVPEFSDPDIREVIRNPCRIVYRVKEQEALVEIARVWHAARDIPEL